jgi:hypothetical protein
MRAAISQFIQATTTSFTIALQIHYFDTNTSPVTKKTGRPTTISQVW